MCTREIEKGPKKGMMELYPDFTVGRSKDLMVRGRSFYAIWDEETGLWSTDEYDVQRLVDAEMHAYAEEQQTKYGIMYTVKNLRSYSSNSWNQFRKFMQNISDNSHQLDETLTFANTEVKRNDYVSKRLSYSLIPGDYSAWDEIIGTLYSPEERAKIEWVIGAIVSGDSKKIQKFLVLYGPGGTGKSTILNIVQKLFDGYTTTFEAKALGGSNNAFSTEAFQHNPLVAIQQDGDLSKIEDNTKLNSIISHEEMTMNVKYKPAYTSRVNAFLLMGTNQPVKISDAKSGIIRRLIDTHPTGVHIPPNHYNTLVAQVDFELGAIAHHCLEVYQAMGKNYYNGYRPTEMMLQTDIFFNFIEAYYDIFKSQNSATLRQAYTLYKEFCDDTGIQHVLPQYKFREELRNYFDDFKDKVTVNGETQRSLYMGFNASKFKQQDKEDKSYSLVMDETKSLLDEMLADCPAQLGTKDEIPTQPWAKVKTTLGEVDTSQLHFVKVPSNHIVIDFDLKNKDGEKDLELNLMEASQWPATYAEHSKGEAGIHLHYIYEGDVTELSSLFKEHIEVKTLLGNSSLRRRLTKCNNTPVASISSGLPIKEKKVLSEQTMKSEKSLRDLIARNFQKEFHSGTKPSLDFIKKILDDAYNSGMVYDVTDLRPRVLAFAARSSNQALTCLKIAQGMKYQSAVTTQDNDISDPLVGTPADIKQDAESEATPVVFYDVEVYPNLFVICWKFAGSSEIVRMVNPKAQEVEQLFKLKLIGFNNRRYDNHILYAAYLGYDNTALYNLSQKIVSNDHKALFGEAYNLSYTDIYDYSSKKQGLKKFQIELGISHMEMDIPWDKPVAEELWDKVVEYCCNDVRATEATHESRRGDFAARQILAELSGLTPNDTTQKHTARIIFGNDKYPQKRFKYPKLADTFPGYVYDMGKSTYRGDNPSEGGYVYAEPGMYENVAVLDVASMHPTSIEVLNLFGDEYTKRFAEIKDARVAIKHGNYDKARTMFDGKLEPYLKDKEDAKALSDALKIAINIVYGLTSAKFDNPFRDVRNKDNVVAKRGALFMIELKNVCQELGLTVAHIKTDSIKIPNATDEDIAGIVKFGKEYGYDFEHEITYEKFCLVNDAVYIAFANGKWEATGAQFAHPYIYKSLFSGEPIEFDDLCETKQVTQGAMYLDFEYDKPELTVESMQFVGRTGRFVPVTEGSGGAKLYRVKDEKTYAVTGTKDHFWMEADMYKTRQADVEVDMTYFEGLCEKAIASIGKYGPFDEFSDCE